MPAYSEAYLEALASCPPSQRKYDTFELYHPAWAEPAYIVANVGDDMQFGIEVGAAFNSGATVSFVACPLSSPWPEVAEGQVPTAQVSIDNVARDLVPKLEEAQSVRAYIRVNYRQYLKSDLTEPAYGPVEYTLISVVMTGATLTGTVMIGNYQNKRWPKQSKNYTPTQFPSLLPG